MNFEKKYPTLIERQRKRGSMTSRREFIQQSSLAALTWTLGLHHCTINQSAKPNILLILTDDQGWGDIHSHGNEYLNTPTMDKLADSGARFDHFYVSPLCAPTRAALLTGRYYLRTGVHGVSNGKENLRSDEVTMAEIFKQNGYATGCFGKWHNGAHYPYDPNGKGFDEFLGFCAGHWGNFFDPVLQHNSNFEQTEGYIADVTTDAAIRFIQKNQNNPFFLYVPYNPPHSPFQVPDQYFDKYKAKGLNNKDACVYGMCENLDDNIERLLNYLEKTNLRKNTIVVFITDNGPNGERFNGGMKGIKGSCHEGGIRVPCFISWPGQIPEKKHIEELAAGFDILPTLADLTGIKKPQTKPWDGVSLKPLLMEENPEWKSRTLYTHLHGRGGARTASHRLYVDANKKIVALYNMIEDPGETRDISKLNPALTAKLLADYQAWHKDVTKDGFEIEPIPVGYKEASLTILPAHEAMLLPGNWKGIRYHGSEQHPGMGWAHDWIDFWTDIKSSFYWDVNFVKTGIYHLTMKYACRKEDAGSKIKIIIADQQIELTIDKAFANKTIHDNDRHPRNGVMDQTWGILDIGDLNIKKGKTKVEIKAISKAGERVIAFKALHISRQF